MLSRNILQAEEWFKPYVWRESVTSRSHGLRAAACFTSCVDGLILLGARRRDENLLIRTHDDIPADQDAAAASDSHVPAVNTLFNALANEPDFARLDFLNW